MAEGGSVPALRRVSHPHFQRQDVRPDRKDEACRCRAEMHNPASRQPNDPFIEKLTRKEFADILS
jgi:hypothetical protein